MKFDFSPDEILKLAAQIEKNGIDFYKRAAKETRGNGDIRKQFLKLSEMENEHLKIFKQMLKNLGDKHNAALHDPEGHVILYFKAWVDRQVFDNHGRIADTLVRKKSIAEILKIAISLERDSILFYLGMKEMTEIEGSQNEIDYVIKEEMKHIAFLIKEFEIFQT